MKCDEYLVLCDCVARGVVAGWHRAHKHQDSPPAESIHACIENAVMLAISNYFQFNEARDAEPGKTSDQSEDALGMAANCQESRQVEPVAYIAGYKRGYCVIEPVDRNVLLPAGMALYRAPLAPPGR